MHIRHTSFHLASMDPGGTTGMTLMRITPESFNLEDQRDETYIPEEGHSPIRVLKEWLNTFTSLPHVLVYENFHMRPHAAADTTAIDIIGALNQWITDEQPYTKVIRQEPGTGKRPVPDHVLARAGLLRPGHTNRHMNDATRHAVSYLASIGHIPLCRAAWPPRALLRSKA